MEWKIPLSDLDFGPEEQAAVDDVLQQQMADHGFGHTGI